MAYPVIKAVEVNAQENGEPRTLHLGIATDDSGRSLFGVSDVPQYPAGDRYLTHMSYIVGGSFDPEKVLERTRRTGWFVFHAGSGLKVSATELEVAFYKLKLITRLGAEAAIQEALERLADMDIQPTTKAPAQHLPRRGDAVERWLEASRGLPGAGPGWVRVVNQLLEDYRMRADAGVALDADLEG